MNLDDTNQHNIASIIQLILTIRKFGIKYEQTNLQNNLCSFLFWLKIFSDNNKNLVRMLLPICRCPLLGYIVKMDASALFIIIFNFFAYISSLFNLSQTTLDHSLTEKLYITSNPLENAFLKSPPDLSYYTHL